MTSKVAIIVDQRQIDEMLKMEMRIIIVSHEVDKKSSENGRDRHSLFYEIYENRQDVRVCGYIKKMIELMKAVNSICGYVGISIRTLSRGQYIVLIYMKR